MVSSSILYHSTCPLTPYAQLGKRSDGTGSGFVAFSRCVLHQPVLGLRAPSSSLPEHPSSLLLPSYLAVFFLPRDTISRTSCNWPPVPARRSVVPSCLRPCFLFPRVTFCLFRFCASRALPVSFDGFEAVVESLTLHAFLGADPVLFGLPCYAYPAFLYLVDSILRSVILL